MTHFEQMELHGQINIFEFMEAAPKVKRRKVFVEGNRVKIKFYADEIEFIQSCHPQLMEEGEIIGKHHDFYIVRIGEIELYVEGEKLKAVKKRNIE